jgi:hypothetical protein
VPGVGAWSRGGNDGVIEVLAQIQTVLQQPLDNAPSAPHSEQAETDSDQETAIKVRA